MRLIDHNVGHLYFKLRRVSTTNLLSPTTYDTREQRFLYMELCVNTNDNRLNIIGRKNILPCILELSHNRQRTFKEQ